MKKNRENSGFVVSELVDGSGEQDEAKKILKTIKDSWFWNS